MVNILGQEIPIGLDITGFISNTWVWVAIVLFIGLIAITGVGLLLFFKAYNRKIDLYEDLSGRGYQKTGQTRARVVKLNKSGDELLLTLKGKNFITAYGKKSGKNTYSFAKGPDGYWYNIVFGDLDTKMGVLDIEPVDRDVRMFHVALDRMSYDNYGQKSKLPTILMAGGIFLALIILLVGMYVVAGRFVDASHAITQGLQSIPQCAVPQGGSGLISA